MSCFLYLRRTRCSAGGRGDQHLVMCSISRFLENLAPGMNPGIKGKTIKGHKHNYLVQSYSPRGKWISRQPQENMQSLGSRAGSHTSLCAKPIKADFCGCLLDLFAATMC